jgi:hypothetical protein
MTFVHEHSGRFTDDGKVLFVNMQDPGRTRSGNARATGSRAHLGISPVNARLEQSARPPLAGGQLGCFGALAAHRGQRRAETGRAAVIIIGRCTPSRTPSLCRRRF